MTTRRASSPRAPRAARGRTTPDAWRLRARAHPSPRHDARGHTRDPRSGGHVGGDHRPGSDEGTGADRHATEDDGPRSDRCAVVHLDAEQLPVVRRLDLPRRVEDARRLVVDEHHAVSDEDVVTDAHTVTDEGMALDLAVGADHGSPLDLDEGADHRSIADAAPVEVRER